MTKIISNKEMLVTEVMLDKALQHFSKELQRTHPLCNWDMETSRYILELKCRTSHYSALIIEYHKYIALLNEATNSDRKAYYIVSTPIGVYSFNITSIPEPVWVTEKLPASTYWGNAEQTKVTGYYHTHQALRLTQVENRLNINNK